MKYAFMTFSTPQMTLSENIEIATRLGYSGIEPRVESKHQHGIELEATQAERAEIKKQFDDSAVELCCLATSIKYLQDLESTQEQEEMTARYLELAANIGCPRLRVFGHGHGDRDGFSAVSANQNRLAEVLAKVAPLAEAHQVQICLETHDYWCNPKDIAPVMKQVNHPMIGVNWDIMHPVRACGMSVEESYALLKPWVFHFHMHQGTTNLEKIEFLPMDDPAGAFDHGAAIALLAKDEYDGFMSGEWFKWEPEESLTREIRIIKEIEASVLKG